MSGVLGFWDQVIAVGALFLVSYMVMGNLRRNPEWLSLSNLNKSFRFMGFLAIFLIGFVSFLVMLLPTSGKAETPGKAPVNEQQINSGAPSRPQRSI